MEISITLIPAKIPPQWTHFVHELSGIVEVEAAGHRTRVEITVDDLSRIYLPLLAGLSSRAETLKAMAAPTTTRRLIAGLAGIPGGGKSVFAATLVSLANRVLAPGMLVVVGMDGWHWPNAVLDQRWTRDAAGLPIPLRQRKGGPESYDVPALVAAVELLRSSPDPPALPVYDRRLHDPVPLSLRLPAHACIVLLEGNYLLVESAPWNQVGPLIDIKLYLDTDEALARERIIARHIRGGLAPEQARRKYELNDAPNTTLVQSTMSSADHVLRF